MSAVSGGRPFVIRSLVILSSFVIRHSSFVIRHSSFVIRHSSFPIRPSSFPMFGLLNINKPSGITSRRVVDRVARLVKPHKAGHAGTLDPLASGVLVVCVGQATRLIEYVQRMPKRYRATFLLGRSSPTEDIEGDVSELPGAPQPSLDQIEQAARGMLGQLAQRPPAFSAVKVDGRRSYDLARAGRAVELAPRTIEVHAIALVGYSYPQLELDIRCGSGTYV